MAKAKGEGMTLQDLLQYRGVPFQRGYKPGEIKLRCPFCGDQRFLLNVNTIKGVGLCFNAKCGWKSKHAIPLILRALKLPTEGVTGAQSDAPIHADAPHLPEGFHLLYGSHDDMDNAATKYLIQERRITREQIRKNRIGVTYFGRYSFRIVLPVFDGKELQGLVCRALGKNQEPRYLNSAGEKSIYNIAAAKETTALLEGPFKALRMEQMLKKANINAGAVAVLGHSITDLQLKQLKDHNVKRTVLCPDLDRVGRQGMVEVGQKLKERGLNVELMLTPEPADEASLATLFKSWNHRIPFDWHAANRLLLPI